jgi:hypothetical protein
MASEVPTVAQKIHFSDYLVGRPIAGVYITNSGNTGATSGTTELDLVMHQLPFPTGLTLSSSRLYLYRAQTTFTKTVAGDTFDFKLRANTALSGTQIGQSGVNPTDGLTIGQRTLEIFFVGSSSYTKLFLSATRSAGTGTLTGFGSVSGFIRSWSVLHDIGDSGVWSAYA